MKLAITMTVCDRPWYLQKSLDSWSAVRDIDLVDFYFHVEPTEYTEECTQIIHNYFPFAAVMVNSHVYGSQLNPFYALDDVFNQQIDYAILAEDDLVVSDDILEYHQWAAQKYYTHAPTAMVCSFSQYNSAAALSPAILRAPNFASVWVWGTWRDRWNAYLKPNWDTEYKYGEGFEKGWDWHFNKRILPTLHKSSLQPMISRVQNIGEVGVHGTTESLVQSPVFELHQDQQSYFELGA